MSSRGRARKRDGADGGSDPRGIILRYDLSSLSPPRKEVCIDSGESWWAWAAPVPPLWSTDSSCETDVDGSGWDKDGWRKRSRMREGERETVKRSRMRESCVWGRELSRQQRQCRVTGRSMLETHDCRCNVTPLLLQLRGGVKGQFH